ncbi:hypothetical protein [Planococcus sp. CAU13]|uniref:hypothetical protein n=1 Tax=Planococcus sp. CAU13 TaxID=1541197 RepID=UPI00126A031A|nr:hypothetical protein [Planococcus sp. CAU13]
MNGRNRKKYFNYSPKTADLFEEATGLKNGGVSSEFIAKHSFPEVIPSAAQIPIHKYITSLTGIENDNLHSPPEEIESFIHSNHNKLKEFSNGSTNFRQLIMIYDKKKYKSTS